MLTLPLIVCGTCFSFDDHREVMTGQMQLLIIGVLLTVAGVAMIFVLMPWRKARLERADQKRGILNAFPNSPGQIGLLGLCFLGLAFVAFTIAGIAR